MADLSQLKNISGVRKNFRRVGRGTGCKKGKTCGRGQKGMGARSGYKTRQGYIGGGVPLHRRLPTRGFSNARFANKPEIINLKDLEKLYSDGETVSFETLKAKNFIKGQKRPIKVLGQGQLTKKLKFDVEFMSQTVKNHCGV